MALTLVVETGAGLDNANSYVSLADANAYHEAHVQQSVWEALSSTDRERAVVMATRVIDDHFTFKGRKTDRLNALKWPRYNMTDEDGWVIDSGSIPTRLKNATAEMARLLTVEDRTLEADTKGFSRLKIDVVELDVDRGDRRAVIPPMVARMLAVWTESIHGSTYTAKLVRG